MGKRSPDRRTTKIVGAVCREERGSDVREDNEKVEKIALLEDEEVGGVREDENGYLRNMSSQEEETAADGDESRSGRLE